VQFDPATAGSFAGQLTIASSATTGIVALAGTGQAHKVALNWSAPSGSSDPVAGYNVYRTVPGTTSYQRLNATVQSQTTYTDSTLQSGSSYSYEVTSVDANGVESTPSNVAGATIP
jgi:fibronectin type 3 domain-containing protein